MALTDQMIRAARLDVNLYEEVEHDATQTQNALIVVVIVAVATAISSAITANSEGGSIALVLIASLVAPILGWVVSAGCIYFIGTRLFGGTATWGEVMRTIGFAQSPGVLNILRFIPVLGGLIGLIVTVWVIVAQVIAIRQALDVTTGKAIVAGVVGGLLAAILIGLVLSVVLVPAALISGAGR